MSAFVGCDSHVASPSAAARAPTSLHSAAYVGNEESIARWIAAGTPINATDKNGFSALHWAALAGRANAVILLLKNGAFPDAGVAHPGGARSLAPLHAAVLGGNVDVVQALLQGGAKPHGDVTTPLNLAIVQGRDEIARVLLMHGAPIVGRLPPLHVAAANGRFATCQLLVERGAEVAFRTPLDHRIRLQDFVPLAIESREERRRRERAVESPGPIETMHIDSVTANLTYGSTALDEAACGGHTDVIEFLIGHGAEVESADAEGRTALYWAAKYGKDGALAALLRHGSNVSIADTSGLSPLHWAAQEGRIDAVRMILEAGADPNAQSWKEAPRSILPPAANPRSGGAVAPTPAQRSADQTPLHLAAQRGHVEIIRVLIAGGAASDIKDAAGMTPIQRAADVGNAAAVKAFQDGSR